MRIAIIYNLPEKLSNSEDALADEESFHTANAIKESLKDEHHVEVVRVSKISLGNLRSFDLVFNLAENTAGCEFSEEEIAKYMEDNKITFTGAGSKALKECLDKELTKKRLASSNIITPRFQVFKSDDDVLDRNLGFPLIVKPLFEDGSIGIDKNSYVENEENLREKVAEILNSYNEPALAEEYIEGREINAAFLGDEILPLSEIVFDLPEGVPKILTYECKWVTESELYKKTMGKCPAEIEKETEYKIKKAALSAARIMGCRDYARIDFRVKEDGTPYVLEVNPNPCISPDGAGFVRSASLRGYSYRKMIEKIISFAITRRNKNILSEK